MGREIKFRAWDSKNKFMLDSAYGDWVSFNGVPYTEATVKYNTPHIEIEKAKEYVLMQYTGLKDKYGAEIFEGDIVKANLRHKDIEIIGKVGMPKSCWVVTFLNPTNGYFNQRRTAEFNELEIIGNIHENPELLPGPEQATEAKPLL